MLTPESGDINGQDSGVATDGGDSSNTSSQQGDQDTITQIPHVTAGLSQVFHFLYILKSI